MIRTISIDDFIALNGLVPLIDVRTPAEFAHGHVPGAHNIPLFSNEERVQVGTTYKQVGREEAILLGFDLTGAKWSGFIKTALHISPDKKVAVHCWRGGMRSGAMAWALDLYGFEVYLIRGGYKHYRRWVHRLFERRHPLMILGGMTGSGKTRILQEMALAGEQIIDLEDLAQHQGSSYGTMNRMQQPTQEQFENNLGDKLKDLDLQRRIWVEDESISIGKRYVPKPFWDQMRSSPVMDLVVPGERRVRFLAEEYGKLDKDFLIECTDRIRKRLGPLQTKQAVEAIREDRMEDFVKIVLVYYDKTYRTGLSARAAGQVQTITLQADDFKTQAQQVISEAGRSAHPTV